MEPFCRGSEVFDGIFAPNYLHITKIIYCQCYLYEHLQFNSLCYIRRKLFIMYEIFQDLTNVEALECGVRNFRTKFVNTATLFDNALRIT